MVIRCSLLGHDYGESEVEREREERGSEVVITLREIQECARCGNRSVVSENKEVTSIEPVDAEADPSGSGPEPLSGRDEAGNPEPAVSAGIVERAETESAGNDGFEDATPQDPEHDDGVILDDEESAGEPAEREYGQWPEPEETPAAEEASEPRAWPEVEGEDEGFNAEPATGDDGATVGLSDNLTPEVDAETTDEGAEFIEATEPSGRSQFEAAATPEETAAGTADAGTGIASAPSTTPAPRSDEPGEFVCPHCDFVRDAAGSSLRAGDICPDCRRGYLAEQDV